MTTAQVVMVSGLMPSSSYNCSVTSFSYSAPSTPAHISITTAGRYRSHLPRQHLVSSTTSVLVHTAKERKTGVAAIAALAVLSVLLIGLLVLFLLVLRKKHLQISR